jgi:hypothetical protein
VDYIEDDGPRPSGRPESADKRKGEG